MRLLTYCFVNAVLGFPTLAAATMLSLSMPGYLKLKVKAFQKRTLVFMPPLNSGATRKLVRSTKAIPGQKSLHRGIHIHQNAAHTKSYKTNPTAKRADPTELLVHHQKIKSELEDVYRRTAALHSNDMTMEERIEERWKAFERAGGRRPQKAVGLATHLEKTSQEKKKERSLLEVEMNTSGEAYDYSEGASAAHNAKDRRVRQHVQRQLKRAHLLKRYGDPTPLKQSGKYDSSTATLNVFKKTIRQVGRMTAHDARVQSVKGGRGGGKHRSKWDLRETTANVNRPTKFVVRDDTADSNPGRRGGGGRGRGRGGRGR